MPQPSFSLQLVSKIPLTHDVYELTYAGQSVPVFLPGQFLLCDCDSTNPQLRRSYSVSWAEGNRVSFIVKRIPEGKGGSVALCDQPLGHSMIVW